MRRFLALSALSLVLACGSESLVPVAPDTDDPAMEEDTIEVTPEASPDIDEGDEDEDQSGVRVWPQGVVPFVIDPSIDFATPKIMEAIDTLNAMTDVVLVARTAEPDYIIFTLTDETSRSTIGRKGGPQPILLRSNARRNMNLVMHELGHAIGRRHEHQRPDRDQYIVIHLENTNKRRPFALGRAPTNYSLRAYDYDSIMHYHSYEFSTNREPTITKLDGSLIDGIRHGLTATDVETFNELVARSR